MNIAKSINFVGVSVAYWGVSDQSVTEEDFREKINKRINVLDFYHFM